MTTPENFRRRQRVEGALLVLIGLVIAFTTWQDGQEDAAFRRCLVENFEQANDVDRTRARLAEADSSSKTAALNSIHDLIIVLTDPEAKRGDGNRALAVSAEVFERYDRTQAWIAAQRAENPVPPFPSGECSDFAEDAEGGSAQED